MCVSVCEQGDGRIVPRVQYLSLVVCNFSFCCWCAFQWPIYTRRFIRNVLGELRYARPTTFFICIFATGNICVPLRKRAHVSCLARFISISLLFFAIAGF